MNREFCLSSSQHNLREFYVRKERDANNYNSNRQCLCYETKDNISQQLGNHKSNKKKWHEALKIIRPAKTQFSHHFSIQ